MDVNVIGLLDLVPALHSMADTLLYKIRVAESLDQLDWVHGRADGFALGLSVAGAVTSRQSDDLMMAYMNARHRREEQLKVPTALRPGASSLELI
jgi:hypothetical protein